MEELRHLEGRELGSSDGSAQQLLAVRELAILERSLGGPDKAVEVIEANRQDAVF